MKLLSILLFVVCLPTALVNGATARPNILFIISEDTGAELSCYGDKNIQTPTIDRLAREGLLFQNAYVTQASCSPSRSSILTGLYPHENGHIGLASHGYLMREAFPTTYSLLQKAGYITGMIGKLHVNPAKVTEDYVDFRAIPKSNFGKEDLHDYAIKSEEFLTSAKTSGKPFFLTVNYPDAHWPLKRQIDGRPKNPVNPEDVVPMPFIGFDNPRIRKLTANYYNGLMRLDECMADLLEVLKETGQDENTMVVYIGDHGAQMARAKVSVLEGGSKIPFIIKWPGKVEPGRTSKALVSTIDLLPTLVGLAGGSIPQNVSGKSLLPLMKGEIQDEEFRKFLATEGNSEEAHRFYPQRTIRDARYKLIWSPIRDRPNQIAEDFMSHSEGGVRGGPNHKELREASERTRKAYAVWLNPPEYQLYDLSNDPWEFSNLGGQQAYAAVEKRLKQALREWMKEANDWLPNK